MRGWRFKLIERVMGPAEARRSFGSVGGPRIAPTEALRVEWSMPGDPTLVEIEC